MLLAGAQADEFLAKVNHLGGSASADTVQVRLSENEWRICKATDANKAGCQNRRLSEDEMIVLGYGPGNRAAASESRDRGRRLSEDEMILLGYGPGNRAAASVSRDRGRRLSEQFTNLLTRYK